MKLVIRAIRFFPSGALSAELGTHLEIPPPSAIAVDMVEYRVYIPKAQVPDSIAEIEALARTAIAMDPLSHGSEE